MINCKFLGLSLSQAARKHDIPYPTFVLYANRVHNMLGPSITNGNHTVGAGNMNLGKCIFDYLENVFSNLIEMEPTHSLFLLTLKVFCI